MKEYIRITKQEKKAIIIMTVILMLINIILCFKGMELMQRNIELIKEKEALEEIITIPAYDFTEEQYQEFLQRKRKAELEKPRWKGEGR